MITCVAQIWLELLWTQLPYYLHPCLIASWARHWCTEQNKSWLQRDPQQELMTAPAGRPRLRVFNLNGAELYMLDTRYAIPRPFKYVSPSTRIKDVFSACCETLQWPEEFMSLTIGDHTYKCPRRDSEQKHLDIFVMTLIPSSGSQRLSDVSYDFTYYCWVPDNFQAPGAQGYCLCHFGGCCRLCFVPGNGICWGCGNNGCCHSVNCGCYCCKSPKGFHPERRCPMAGCRPEWADGGLTQAERPAGFTL